MKNIIRADIYRIFRGKGIYITIAVLIGIIVLQMAAGANINAGIRHDDFELIGEILDGNEEVIPEIVRPTGRDAPFMAMTNADVLLFILLPLLIFISTADFSSLAVKNVLSSGISRCKYYTSKLTLSCIVCVILLFVYVSLSLFVGVIISGFDGAFNGEYIIGVAKVFFSQLFIFLALICVGNFFVFLVRSNVVIGVYIAFVTAPSIILLLLSLVNEWFENLVPYDLTLALGKVVNIEMLTSGEVAEVLFIGAGYIIAAAIGGYYIFRKAEIK
ncbi:MAG: hypothetical protein LBD23_11935 [Oscillospiraceae bacterium]|jgi:ABC-2 type transport system permease protein|nr:hypothetical protein [Oscillospiraceae bacterium]